MSGPSGVGKTTLAEAVMANDDALQRAITHTSRPQRSGEIDGVHYHFVSNSEFTEMVAAGEFLESVHIFGFYYGTSRAAVQKSLAQGIDTVLIIDFQGAREVRQVEENLTSVFIFPPSLHALRRRLLERGDTDDATLSSRVEKARYEMSHYHEYDFVVVNDSFDSTIEQLHEIIDSVRRKEVLESGPVEDEIRSILASP